MIPSVLITEKMTYKSLKHIFTKVQLLYSYSVSAVSWSVDTEPVLETLGGNTLWMGRQSDTGHHTHTHSHLFSGNPYKHAQLYNSR